jgi:hypothetical protein
VLGIGQTDAVWLRKALLESVQLSDAVELSRDAFGTRWRTDVVLSRDDRTATVRCIWLVPLSESVPRFVTCWVR